MTEMLELWWLFLGMIIFVAMVAFVLRRGAKEQYDKDAQIPLKDERP